MSREGMKTRNFFLLILLFLLIALTSCGLYESPYLDAPSVKTVVGSGTAEIYNRTNNNPEVFRGYELYYRYFNNSSEIAEIDKKIFSTAEPEPDDLTSNGYKRVITAETTENKTSYPMIPVDYSDRSSSFTLTINLPGSDIIPAVDYLGNTIVIRRAVTKLESGKYYYEDFTTTDHDISDSDIPSDAAGTITLSLYLFSYGKDDNVYNIYSKPVWLGSVDYPL